MISMNNISMRFGAKVLFDEVSLRVAGKDRVSLVGSNGAGKSTMLKVIAGLIKPDEGEVAVSKHTTVGYLPQEGIEYTGKTLYEEVYSSAGDINAIQEEMRQIEKEMEEFQDTMSDEFMDLINEYGELQERFQMLDGFKIKSKIEKILIGLGFGEKDFDRETSEFSGGWQMRISLAKLLLNNPSILLLDEPTNHLDIESLIWVENYLKAYQGAIVMVSHDRSFLDNITERTVEISLGNVTEYSGNYSFYKREREVRKELLENQFNNQQSYLKQQEKFIERFRYKATKSRQVQSRIKLLDKIDLVELEDEEATVNFNFPPATHSGKISLEISELTKSYDGTFNVLENIDLIIPRGEKIAFVGVNGAGKSTLMRIIAGIEKYEGEVKLGHLAEIKFYAQNQAEELDSAKTVLQTMEEAARGDIIKNLRSILGSFLFRGDDVFKKVGVLSGGEKSRLALAKMLIEPSNFLVFDEPTNHLDMKSKEVLMNALQKYEGTVVIVSHDREFIDGIVDKVIEVKNKKIRTYFGNATDYLKAKDDELKKVNSDLRKKTVTESKENIVKTVNPPEPKEQKKTKKDINKIIMPIKNRINELERNALEFEAKIKEKETIMSKDEFYKGGYNVVEFTNDYNSLKEKLKNVYSLWEQETEKLNSLSQ
ncbi:MAG: ABC-F family ATP-binding cassette domain-containing protein [Ignavibacteria bacterium]|nr:ABC-F family ATP-binding cassette domain-containing protein [Ignavibacteria bacterium]MBK9406376.1 ABC-F family ATP-binding cassette domain-containing protein [Ignavibacteria bacterium]